MMASKSICKTGPRTKRGKAAAKLNAITHGVTALSVPPAEQVAYRTHRQGILEAYQPSNAVEEFLCDRIALLMWRLRRLDAWEAFQLEAARREAIAFAAFRETAEATPFDALEYRDPALRFANIRPEVMTLEQARVEIERITNEQAWRYLKDAESIAELEATGRHLLAYPEAVRTLSDPPTLAEVRAHCDGELLGDALLGAAYDLYDTLTEWGVEADAIALAVLGREPSEDDVNAMAEPTEWDWQAAHLVELWRLVDTMAETLPEGKPARMVIHSAACRQIVDGVRLQGIAQRVRLLMADAERSGLVLAAVSEAKHHRYDTNLERSLFKAMHELEALQEKRRGGAAPLARVEVHGGDRQA